jgi:hypothetical protein
LTRQVKRGRRYAAKHPLPAMTENMTLHDSRMTPNFNYTLEPSVGGASRLHATETRPRVCEPSGKARLRSEVSHAHRAGQPTFRDDKVRGLVWHFDRGA